MLVLPRRLATNAHGHFDLATMCVHESFEEAAHRAAIRRHVREEDGTQMRVGLTYPQSILAQDADIFRTREHEWTHFRHHISTPHGVFLHRLCGLQEQLTLQYFKSLPHDGAGYRPLPFRILCDRDGDTPNPLLNAWFAADMLRGLLWGKTTDIASLKQLWTICTSSLHQLVQPFAAGDRAPAALASLRPDGDGSCPDGHLAIREIAEGFAKFREFAHLAELLGAEVAMATMPKPEVGAYGSASKFLSSVLALSTPFHPFAGALMDVAMATFEDPMMVGPGNDQVWENIHPGLRLEAVALRLGRAPKTWPLRRSDAYGEALEAFRLETAIPQSAARWLQASDGRKTGEKSEADPIIRFQAAQCELFLEGLKLRRDHPGIFYDSSGVADQAARSRYRDHCRPLLVRGPRRLFVPWGWSRDEEFVVLALYHGLVATMLHEVAQDAELKRTFAYARRAQQIVDFDGKAHDHLRAAFAKARVVELARRCFGAAAEPLILSTRKF
jgi:hypothetical protein